MKNKKLSLCCHITFFFIEERLQNLDNVINAILNFNQFSDIKIYIHTNKHFNHKSNRVEIVVHDITKLQHPFLLTWMHRKILKSNIDNYDIFMYNEDDILISNENIDYWFDYQPFLSKYNLDLGFIRLEVDNKNNEYVVDLQPPEKHSNRIMIFDGVDEKLFCILNKNYRGFWIYDRETMIKFSSTENFCDIPSIIHDCRENAARGFQQSYQMTIIPIKENNIHKGSKVYHLTNNYYNDPTTGHGKILFKNCI